VILVLLLLAAPALAGEWDGSAFALAAPQGMRAWLVLPTRMVPDDADLPASESPQPFELRAGRNEYECAQLVVMTAKASDPVSAEFSDFIADGGDQHVESPHAGNSAGLGHVRHLRSFQRQVRARSAGS